MATIINGSKILHQVFKCYNCGRKSVSLGNDFFDYKMAQQENQEESVFDESELLDDLMEQKDEWVATCSHCGWSDS